MAEWQTQQCGLRGPTSQGIQAGRTWEAGGREAVLTMALAWTSQDLWFYWAVAAAIGALGPVNQAGKLPTQGTFRRPDPGHLSLFLFATVSFTSVNPNFP